MYGSSATHLLHRITSDPTEEENDDDYNSDQDYRDIVYEQYQKRIKETQTSLAELNKVYSRCNASFHEIGSFVQVSQQPDPLPTSSEDGVNICSLPPDTLDKALLPFLQIGDILSLRHVCKHLSQTVPVPSISFAGDRLPEFLAMISRARMAIFRSMNDDSAIEAALDIKGPLETLKWMYWQKSPPSLRKVLNALKSNVSIKSLEFSWINCIHEVIDDLGATFTSSNAAFVSRLNVSRCSLMTAGAAKLFTALKHSKSLLELNMSGNQIFSIAEELTDFLKTNRSVRLLDLSYNNLGDYCIYYIGQALRSNKSLQTLQLQNNRLGGKSFQNFATMLTENATLTDINLDFTDLTDRNVQDLCSSMLSNTTLRHLKIHDGSSGVLAPKDILWEGISKATSTLSVRCLNQAQTSLLGASIKYSSRLVSLEMIACRIEDDSLQTLSMCLSTNTTLRRLCLAHNQIGAAGSLSNITSIIASSNHLLELDLSYNRMQGKDIEAFTEALARNTTLQVLNLSSNPLGFDGVNWIAYALEDNVTMCRLHLDVTLQSEGPAGSPAAPEDLVEAAAILMNAIEVSAPWRHYGIEISI